MKKENLKCLFVSSEIAPYAKTGGLADVGYALPKALKAQGIDVRMVTPLYEITKRKYPEIEEKVHRVFNVPLGWRNKETVVCYEEHTVPTYFIKSDDYFHREGLYGYGDDAERFAYFCKATLELLMHIDFVPDIIHCNDWQTGAVALLLKDKFQGDSRYQQIKTVFTIHNMKYQGVFSKEQMMDVLELDYGYTHSDSIEFNGGLSFMKAGLLYSDHINTVSPTYAQEIRTWMYGCGLDRLLNEVLGHKLSGILNGIDYDLYNPKTDPHLYKNYDENTIEEKKLNKQLFQKEYGLEEKDTMMVSIISRMTDQKGFDLLKQTVDSLWVMDKLMEMDIQFVILGTGEAVYEDMFKHFQYVYGNRVKLFLTFDEKLAQRIYAASDVFLMPSAFEPCGLGQLMAMRYGTVPVVRKTGGLKDTVIHYNAETGKGNGFEFEDYSAYWLHKKVEEAYELFTNQPEAFKQVQKNGMESPFSWEEAGKHYEEMYKSLLV